MDAEGLEYYILGDMNVNVNSPNSGSNLRLLIDIADVYGLQQLINEPTRVTNSSSSMIDLIHTNSSTRVACSGVSHIGIRGCLHESGLISIRIEPIPFLWRS